MTAVNKEKLRDEIVRLIREDPTLKSTLIEILKTEFLDKETFTMFAERISALIEEIKNLREDFNKRMSEMRSDFDKRMNEMRADFNKAIQALSIRIDGLGARWGIQTEESVRNMLRGLVEEKFNWKVVKWEYFDEKGIVYGYPSMIEIDIVIRDSEHILVELKSHVRKSDVAEFLRISEIYERKTGIKPSLMIVSPYIDEKAKEFAKIKGIKVYSADDLIY
ncbi:MAG: PD-(D/E)XK nuclease family protein [Candidatus Njordarchaeia archaeon]|nr:DUF3782 domain-containing protein [Candidatus Korarchaeota archaeon]